METQTEYQERKNLFISKALSLGSDNEDEVIKEAGELFESKNPMKEPTLSRCCGKPINPRIKPDLCFGCGKLFIPTTEEECPNQEEHGKAGFPDKCSLCKPVENKCKCKNCLDIREKDRCSGDCNECPPESSWMEEFDEKVKELKDQHPGHLKESEPVYFGYTVDRDDEIFRVVDFGNIKSFIAETREEARLDEKDRITKIIGSIITTFPEDDFDNGLSRMKSDVQSIISNRMGAKI